MAENAIGQSDYRIHKWAISQEQFGQSACFACFLEDKRWSGNL